MSFHLSELILMSSPLCLARSSIQLADFNFPLFIEMSILAWIPTFLLLLHNLWGGNKLKPIQSSWEYLIKKKKKKTKISI